MIFLSDLNHDLNQRFKSNDLNHNNPDSDIMESCGQTKIVHKENDKTFNSHPNRSPVQVTEKQEDDHISPVSTITSDSTRDERKTDTATENRKEKSDGPLLLSTNRYREEKDRNVGHRTGYPAPRRNWEDEKNPK